MTHKDITKMYKTPSGGGAARPGPAPRRRSRTVVVSWIYLYIQDIFRFLNIYLHICHHTCSIYFDIFGAPRIPCLIDGHVNKKNHETWKGWSDASFKVSFLMSPDKEGRCNFYNLSNRFHWSPFLVPRIPAKCRGMFWGIGRHPIILQRHTL